MTDQAAANAEARFWSAKLTTKKQNLLFWGLVAEEGFDGERAYCAAVGKGYNPLVRADGVPRPA